MYMEEIARRLPGNPNHCIVIGYTDPVLHHAPAHRDKSEDIDRKNFCMQAGTGFSVVTVTEANPRRFELLNLETDAVEWGCRLPNLSMVHVSAEAACCWLFEFLFCLLMQGEQGLQALGAPRSWLWTQMVLHLQDNRAGPGDRQCQGAQEGDEIVAAVESHQEG